MYIHVHVYTAQVLVEHSTMIEWHSSVEGSVTQLWGIWFQRVLTVQVGGAVGPDACVLGTSGANVVSS